ncbi:MAG: hypothetical protein P8J87_06860, partial [Verrucomicrobiales bacterium]|nr:hypothetical protein [Verrucomicrobiales bacterium]
MKKMMNWRLAATALAGFALCGCYTKRVVWSSDGGVAAVHGGDGLYLADAGGEISERWLAGECVFDWVPGSRRLVVATVTEEATWEGLAGQLEDTVRGAVKAEAERLMVWLESGGNREDAKNLTGELRMMGGAVELCLVGEFKERLAGLAEAVD